MSKNYGKIYGKPRIKIGYASSISKVRKNIRQKTRSGGLKLGGHKQSFGFGK